MPPENTNWDILGHQWAVDLLRSHLSKNRVRHAYLITGPQGVGRRSLALRFVQGLFCPKSPDPGGPCQRCHTCEQIERMQHPDLAVVQADQTGGILKVDQVRELQRSLSLTPYQANHRVGLFLRFEEANPNAANALLKTLEEPPPQALLILTALDPESLLPTIVSRCEVIRLRPLPLEKVSQGLQDRWDVPYDQAHLLAHLSGGRPGYAIRLYRHPEELKQRQMWLDEHHHLLAANRVERFAYAEDLSKDRLIFQKALQVWLSLWRDVVLRTAGSLAPLSNPDREEEILLLASKLDIFSAQRMVSNLERAAHLSERYVNTRMTAEVLMLDLPQIPA